MSSSLSSNLIERIKLTTNIANIKFCWVDASPNNELAIKPDKMVFFEFFEFIDISISKGLLNKGDTYDNPLGVNKVSQCLGLNNLITLMK